MFQSQVFLVKLCRILQVLTRKLAFFYKDIAQPVMADVGRCKNDLADLKINALLQTAAAHDQGASGFFLAQLCHNIRDRRTGIDLTNLQLYLDRLWREDLKRQGTPTPAKVTFDLTLVERVGKLGNVLSAFLDEELVGIETALLKRGVNQAKGLPLEVLFALVTEEGTKRNLDLPAILDALPGNSAVGEADLRFCLSELERIRLVRPLGG